MTDGESTTFVCWVSTLNCQPNKTDITSTLSSGLKTDRAQFVGFSPVWRISVYEWIIQRQKILRVTDLVFINQEISLHLRKYEIKERDSRQ